MSTYGTWSLILFNIAFVFLSVTIIEPRKREAIAQRVSDANWKSSKLLLVSALLIGSNFCYIKYILG